MGMTHLSVNDNNRREASIAFQVSVPSFVMIICESFAHGNQ